MWYLPGKVQIPFDMEFRWNLQSNSRGHERKAAHRRDKGPPKIRATQEHRERYLTQHREWVLLEGQEDLQNPIITESALGFCLYHSNIHQESEQLFGFTRISLMVVFSCQTLVQMIDPAFYTNHCLLESYSLPGWFRQILSHLRVFGCLDKNATYATVGLCCVWLPESTMSSSSLNIQQGSAGKQQTVYKNEKKKKKDSKHETDDRLPKSRLPAFITKPDIRA